MSRATTRATVRSTLAMDTAVTVTVVDSAPEADITPAIGRALAWFREVEGACSRFDPDSELRRVIARPGEEVTVGPMLFETVRFALALAAETGGALDPTVGQTLEARGFNRHWTTGAHTQSVAAAGAPTTDAGGDYRDVSLDPERRTILLRKPVVLDLGTVAKGFAVDLAARELVGFAGACVEAGGDLFARGVSPRGGTWTIGIQHPRLPGGLVGEIRIPSEGAALCTSGDYERRSPLGDGHHIVDPRTATRRRAAHSVDGTDPLASVTVRALTAMAADGLSTAAFVLGPTAGARLLTRVGAHGTFVTASGRITATTQTQKAAQP